MDTRDRATKKLGLVLLCLTALPALAQDSSLGDVARTSRDHHAQSPKSAKVFTNDDSNPQVIQDGEDPFAVFQRARLGFLHDTAHRCQEESSGNSGPGWKKSATYEVAAADRMRVVSQDGATRVEMLLVGDSYYKHDDGGSWRKLTDPREVRLGEIVFPGALTPQELQFDFQPGDLKSLRDPGTGGPPTVLYRYTVHSTELDRTVNYWIGKQDSLPHRIEMRTETRSSGIPPTIWTESITCSYGVAINIDLPR